MSDFVDAFHTLTEVSFKGVSIGGRTISLQCFKNKGKVKCFVSCLRKSFKMYIYLSIYLYHNMFLFYHCNLFLDSMGQTVERKNTLPDKHSNLISYALWS